MKKFKIFYDFEKEEKYLDSMAKNGFILKKYSCLGVYTFTHSEPKNTNYKIDYRLFKSKDEYQNYLTLFQDAGWQHVYGSKNTGNQYFLPINEMSEMEIFSDRESYASRYKTFYNLCMSNFTCFIAYFTVVLINTNWNISQLGFLTPNLWDMKGLQFLCSFLFELPFVILRIGFPILFAIMAILHGYWGYKTYKKYKEIIKGNENLS